MTLFNPFTNINMNFFSGINNWFTPSFSSFQGFMPTNWMPSFNVLNWNIPSIFSSPFSTNYSSNFNIFSPTQFSFNNIGNFSGIGNNNFRFNFSGLASSGATIGDSFVRSSNSNYTSGSLAKLAENAKKYVGQVNSDREGNRLFSGGKNQPWCADFVSYNIKQTLGSNLPSSFKHFSSVDSLKNWGVQNNCYKQVPSGDKANYIANNVKIGDIMIEKNGSKSHTGIVTKVNSDGSFEVVEGNCGSKVATQKYKANSRTLTGFISMGKFATA